VKSSRRVKERAPSSERTQIALQSDENCATAYCNCRVGCGAVVLTRREFLPALALGVAAAPSDMSGQQGEAVIIRMRVDDSVRQSIPPVLQQHLKIDVDQSDEAKELVGHSPAGRAVPVMFIIVGAIAVPVVLQMMRETVRQFYYGGVLLDLRSQPPSVTSDPKIPANMIFTIDGDGKMSRFTSDQLSPELLASLLKPK
jgi:hypothetical protein